MPRQFYGKAKQFDNTQSRGKRVSMKKRLALIMTSLSVLFLFGCGRASDAQNPSQAQEGTTFGGPTVVAPAKRSHVYSLQWISNYIPQTMSIGSVNSVQVSVKNSGDWTWPDPKSANPSKPDGTYAVRLSYRWAHLDGKFLPQDSVRGDLPSSVPSGAIANFVIDVVAPKDPGSYKLQLDLVEELVNFFSAKGGEKLIVPVTVQ